MAASAVEYQSVTVEQDLDTVEVRSSSLLVPTIFLNQFPKPPSENQGPLGSNKRSDSQTKFVRQIVVDRRTAPVSKNLLNQVGLARRQQPAR